FLVITGDGTYAVKITDDDGCSRLSDGFPVAVGDVNGWGGVLVYPNPAGGDQFTVSGLQSIVGGASVKIYDMLGKTIYSGVLNGKQKTVNCRQFSPGIYLLEVSDGERVYRSKFVKD